MTELAATERALLTALATIRDNWTALIATGSPGSIASQTAPRALYTRDDNDERTDDLPPVDQRIALRHDVTATLNSWVRLIVEERDLTHHLPLGTDTLGLVEFLERWARWFSGHEASADAVAEIRAWAGKVEAITDPQRREWLPLGTCPLEITLDAETTLGCGGQVRAYPGRDPKCMKCGTEATAAWWERVMFPDMECSDLVTADELVLFLHRAFGGAPVKPSTLRQWVSREVIKSAGKDPQGRSLYSREEVIKTIAERVG